MKRLAFLALAACHHGTPAPTDDTLVNETVQQDELFVDARTLLVTGPTPTTPRVQLARFGVGQIALGGESIDGQEQAEWFDTLAVSETRGTKVRVRYDEDGDARLLIWIDRTDLRTVVTLEAGVATGPTAAIPVRGEAGAWLHAGALVDQLAPAKDGARRTFVLEDDEVTVRGELEASALGLLFVPQADVSDRDDWRFVKEGVGIRVAPAATAAVIATTTQDADVLVTASKDGWTELDLPGRQVDVHGFVPDAALFDPFASLTGTRDAAGYGAHAAHKGAIDVPAGACLYDGKDGALVGVALATYKRDAQDLKDGWHEVLAGSSWGAFSVAVHEVDGQLEICASGDELRQW